MAALDLEPEPAPTDPPASAVSGAWITLAALICAYVLAFVDRQAPSLLTEPLKQALHLDDAQASLLLGPAFAFVLALAGLPLARRIDTGRRIQLIALATGFWSLMTLGCGLAAGFGTLLLFRMGVGLGEAALTPAAHSVIADNFPPRRMGLALGLYGAGAYLGMGLAYWGGGHLLGLLAEARGSGALAPWRLAFLGFGAPGLLVAAWIATRREPPRSVGCGARDASLRSTWTFFCRRRGAIAAVNLMLAFVAMSAYATTAWAPSLLVRAYGLTTSKAGIALGPLVAATGLAGSLLGGGAADVAEQRWPGGRLRLMALAALAAAPFAAAGPLSPGPGSCLACLGAAFFLATVAISIGPSAQQAIASSALRGAMSMSGVLCVNLLGLGLGPPAIALASEHLFRPGDLAAALACATPAMLLTAAMIGFAGLPAYKAALRLGGATAASPLSETT